MFKKILTLSLIGFGLAACQHTPPAYVAKKPVVTAGETRITVDFAYASSHLDEVARAKVEAFIMDHDVTARDEVFLSIAKEGGKAALERGETLAAYFKHLGVPVGLRYEPSPERLQSVGVSLVRYSIHVKGCPDWSQNPSHNFSNQLSGNFGCATASNLALMIGNPKDLLQGQDSTLVDGMRASRAVELYRSGELEAIEVEGENELQGSQ